MRRRPPYLPDPEEMSALRKALVSCPGVNQVLSITKHGKGGYVAVLDFSMEKLDAFIEHLEHEGWMNVF